MPDPLPWSEVLRRRNGLPPTELDDVAVLRSVGLDRSAQPLAPYRLTPEQLGKGCPTLCDPDCTDACHEGDVVRWRRDHEPGSCIPEPRCDLTDLPTTMCHHCKET
jgi:hypothetical protein